MNVRFITRAICRIIKALVQERDERLVVMCHNIHRVVNVPKRSWFTAERLEVQEEHGVPPDRAAAAVPA